LARTDSMDWGKIQSSVRARRCRYACGEPLFVTRVVEFDNDTLQSAATSGAEIFLMRNTGGGAALATG